MRMTVNNKGRKSYRGSLGNAGRVDGGHLKHLHGFPYLIRSEKGDCREVKTGQTSQSQSSESKCVQSRRTIPFVEAAVPAAINRFCRRHACRYKSNCLLWRERSDDCLEARVATQGVPQRVETQIPVSHMAPWQFGCFRQSFNCPVLVARPRINDSQVLD